MIIYKDIISGDELFSDVYPIEVFQDLFLKVKGKLVSEDAGGIDESLIGGNKSAEAEVGDGDVDDCAKTTGCNIVIANKLVEMPAFDKKSLMSYFKGYCKEVVTAMKNEEKSEKDIDEFKKGAPAAVKYLASKLKDWQYFSGENMNPDGSMGFLDYLEDGVTPYMLFFKHGVIEEKV